MCLARLGQEVSGGVVGQWKGRVGSDVLEGFLGRADILTLFPTLMGFSAPSVVSMSKSCCGLGSSRI